MKGGPKCTRLFPYTTLFRSDVMRAVTSLRSNASTPEAVEFIVVDNSSRDPATYQILDQLTQEGIKVISLEEPFNRSEEHTSELQSHVNLVCRLLLEKKNEQN